MVASMCLLWQAVHLPSLSPGLECCCCCCTAVQEGQYEKEGYGQRPYDNWETIMFDCEKQVGGV